MSPLLTASLLFVLPLLLLIVVAIIAARYWDTDAPLSVAVIGAGLYSFVFFYGRFLSLPSVSQSEATLREAIAAAVVLEYIVLVGIVAFFKKGPNQLPPITQTLISNFTTIVGIVIAFYFGSSAYLQATGH